MLKLFTLLIAGLAFSSAGWSQQRPPTADVAINKIEGSRTVTPGSFTCTAQIGNHTDDATNTTVIMLMPLQATITALKAKPAAGAAALAPGPFNCTTPTPYSPPSGVTNQAFGICELGTLRNSAGNTSVIITATTTLPPPATPRKYATCGAFVYSNLGVSDKKANVYVVSPPVP